MEANPAPRDEINTAAYTPVRLPFTSESCPSKPAPKKKPTKNMDDASCTLYSSLHIKLNSETIDCFLFVHFHTIISSVLFFLFSS